MAHELRQQYDAAALRRRIPTERAELFLGFTPWSQDCDGWKRSVRETLHQAPGRAVSRTVWDSPETPEARVLIDVAECSSAPEAIDALLDRLATNQLRQLPEGPSGLGEAAFAHPEGIPPAVFFVRGNLCISVLSFSRRAVPVAPWAERLNRRLGERPSTDRAVLSLRADRSRAKVGEAVAVDYVLPWRLGEDGYLKFFATGGALALRDKRLVVIGTRAGEVHVDAFAVEPGREPYTGTLILAVE